MSVSHVDIVDLEGAVDRLRRGGVVAIPTETVYGLAASALDRNAVAKVFAIKGRPTHHPLIVHLAAASQLVGWGHVDRRAELLARAFWPGPLTLIVPRGPLALDAVTGGLDTVGVRVPAHPVALALLERFGGGLAAPSANRFGFVSPTSAEHVASDLAGEDIGLLDGGPCEVGIESTIVDVSGERPAILRLGAISRDAVEATLGEPVEVALHAARAKAPGQLASHYAPRARLEVVPADRLDERRLELAHVEGEGRVVVLAALGASPAEWARNLYAALRVADAGGPAAILIATPPEGPMRDAVVDRLSRASAPR
jgi:L-threonylcarbamoyladenylate synthase